MKKTVTINVLCPVHFNHVDVYLLPYPLDDRYAFAGCDTYQPCYKECTTVCRNRAFEIFNSTRNR